MTEVSINSLCDVTAEFNGVDISVDVYFGVSGNGWGTTDHDELTEESRSLPAQHPSSSITYGDNTVEEVLNAQALFNEDVAESISDIEEDVSTNSSSINNINDVIVTAKVLNGFEDGESAVISYNSTTRTITILSDVAVYKDAKLIATLVNGWESTEHPETLNKIYHLYHDGTHPVWTDVYPGFDVVIIASIVYREFDKFGVRECHGNQDHESHRVDHYNIGTFRISGGDVSGYTVNSTVAANRRPDVSECYIVDEDLATRNVALTNKLYSQRYINGSNSLHYNLDRADIINLLGNQPYYNNVVGGNYTNTLAPANSVMTVWLYEVPVTADALSQKYRHAWVQPQSITQAQNSSPTALAAALSTERAKNTQSLFLGVANVVSQEYVCIAKVLITYTGGNWYISEVQNITGSRALQIASPSGSYLSSVSTDSTLTGGGTVGDPIGINPLGTPEMADTLITTLKSDADGGIIPALKATWLGATAKSVLSYLAKLVDKTYDLATRVGLIELVTPTTEPTSFTLQLTHLYKGIRSTSATSVTCTIPTDSSVAFPVGSVITIEQTGAGVVSVAGAGVTINGELKSQGQYKMLQIWKVATDTWTVIGGTT